MLYAGLDLSRKRLDFHLLDVEGATVEIGASPPDVDGLDGLTDRLGRHREPIRAAIESMNGARFVHDRLELHGWEVEIADAQKVKGLAPLACKTDRIDAWVLAELARRDLVPAIWLPDPRVRAERAGGCNSSVTARASSSACTRSCSPTASPAPSPTCSASKAGSC
jgi:transposase